MKVVKKLNPFHVASWLFLGKGKDVKGKFAEDLETIIKSIPLFGQLYNAWVTIVGVVPGGSMIYNLTKWLLNTFYPALNVLRNTLLLPMKFVGSVMG